MEPTAMSKPWAINISIPTVTNGGVDFLGRILRAADKANAETVYVTLLPGRHQQSIHKRILRDYALLVKLFGQPPKLKLLLKSL